MLRNSRRAIAIGFAIVLVLLIGIAVSGLRQTAIINRDLQTIVHQHNKRIDLAFTMHSAARERALLLHSMALSQDAFDRDEKYMRFNELATEFARAREKWIGMSHTQEEKRLIEKQKELINLSMPLQQNVVDLIMAGRIREANRALEREAIPAQNRILEQLTGLVASQREAGEFAARTAEKSYRRAYLYMLALGILAVGMGMVTAVLVTFRVKKTEDDLFHEKELAQVTLRSIGDAVITTDMHDQIDYMNPVAEQLTGWALNEARGLPLGDVFLTIDEISREPLEPITCRTLLDGPVNDINSRSLLIRRDNREFAVEISAAPICDRSNQAIGSVLTFRDVTKARTLAQQLTWQAKHDSLTGLMNRREFELHLKHAIENVRIHGGKNALLYIDLDQFKVVNDTCGHIAGDQLLRQLASILGTKLRDSDVLARLGGDEFGVLLDHCPEERAMDIANALRSNIQDFRFAWGDKVFSVGASIGLVIIDSGSHDIESILSAADEACYTAKDMGRNRVHLYHSADHDTAKRHGEMQWVTRINSAFEDNRLCLYYQRIQSLSSPGTKSEHYEILIRMIDESGEIVPPMAFIPAAERYGIMPTIDRWVVRTVLDTLEVRHKSRKSGLDQPLYSINISGPSVGDEKFLLYLQEQIAVHNIPPRMLCFEITETAAITNLSKASHLIQKLKQIGCRFALDDFGSGMSSFTYLKNLPVDFLKIDGSFIVDILRDPADYALVDAINRIGHVLGIQTIAESVENKAILDILGRLEVDYVQGNIIHKPEPFIGLIDASEPARSLGTGIPRALH